jgi:predicted permease
VVAFVLTLGLGIGVNTAIFSVINGVLLEPLPYVDSNRLLYLRHAAPLAGIDDMGFSFVEIGDYARSARTIDEFVEYGDWTFAVAGEAEPHRAVGGLVTSNYFGVLGLRPALGRMLTEADDARDAEPVVVLTHEYWVRAFGGDPGVIDQTIRLYAFSQPRTARIVGVLALASLYTGTRRQEFFVNYSANEHYGGASMLDERTHRMTSVFARLAPGRTIEEARSELAGVFGRLQQEFPPAYPERNGMSVSVESWRHALTSDARPMLLILGGAVVLVLLLACANVANLTLTRLVRRERELAVQAALGAGVWRIRRQLLLENLLLATGGALLGVLLAAVGKDLLTQYASRFTVRTGEIEIDLTVLGATAVIAVGAALLLALAPGLPGTRGVWSPGAGGGRRVVGVTRKHLQRGLVVSQLVLCFTLLVGAGLLVRSLFNLTSVDAGLAYDDVVAVDVPSMTGLNADQNRALLDRAVERTVATGGVTSAAYASHVPFAPATITRLGFRVEGRDEQSVNSPMAAQNVVSPTYFGTIGVRLIRGREFAETDRTGTEPVAIVNESLATHLFGSDDPIDGRIALEQFNGEFGDWLRVVGVVGDTREYGLAEGATHTLYRPANQVFPGQSIIIRTSDAAAAVRNVRGVIREIDPDRPIDNVVTLESLRFEDLAPPRLNATLFTTFAGLALAIAAVGVLGVLAFSVSQRTQEFGVRMAIGARPGQVLSMVLAEGGRMLAVSLVLGVATSIALARFLQSLLFDVATTDPLIYLSVGIILSIVAFVAAYVPARRATIVDPLTALRSE